MTRQEIAKETGLNYDCVRKRIKKLSVNPKESVNQLFPKDPLKGQKREKQLR